MPAAGDSRAQWDFFVSYTQEDRAWAEWIAWILEEDGHRVLVQAWDFVPGSNWIQGMQAGTQDAARTIAVLSPDYLGSVYGSAEWLAAWASDPGGTDRKLLVVRVAASERPGLLGGVVSVDLFGLAEADAKTRLRGAISAALAGRAKPAMAPRFPGSGRAMLREPRFPTTLPKVWRVPARNPNFTGRARELRMLARSLTAGSTVTVRSVHGMGGVGKTQLAVEYAYAYAGDYELVWWIAAEEPASIPDQFATIASHLGLDPVADLNELRNQVHDALRSVPGWLLIFDNAADVQEIQPWLPTGPLPAGIPGHAIVTTRRSGFTSLGRVLDLDVMKPSHATRLLRARVPGLGNAVGRQIAEELGRLPLALEQAGAYMDRAQMPGQDYLELLRGRAADIYTRGHVATHPDTIATVWDISLDRIGTESPAAGQLLDICGCLAGDPIPLDLFTAHPSQLPEPISAAAADQLAFSDTIAVLVDYSIAKRTTAGLQLHRLVQAAIRARHDGPASSPAHASAADSPETGEQTMRLPTPPADPLAVALSLLRADAPEKIMGAPEDWPRWAVLLPQVLAAVGHIGDVTEQTAGQKAGDGSWLLDRAGTYLQVHGRYADAKALQERAVAMAEASLGSDHSDVGIRLSNLCLTLRALGDTKAARQLQERALAITVAAHGPNHPDVGVRLNNLSLILQDLGQHATARPLQERALAIDEAAYGPGDPRVAIALNNLVLILRALGKPETARPLQERALAISESVYGPDHPDVATRLNNLALILMDLGQPRAARPLQERALAIDEAFYGPDHPDVARDLNNLASILTKMGQPEAARPLRERTLAIAQAAYPPNHPRIAASLNNLASVLRILGQPEAARPLQERALAIDEAAYGPEHPDIAIDLSNLALILRALGNPEEARPLMERAVAIDEAALGPENPATGARLNDLAQILEDLGQAAIAAPLRERARAITGAVQAARSGPASTEEGS